MTTLSSNQSYQDQSTELCSFNQSERTLAAETVLALAANADLNAVMSTLAYPIQSTELCSFNQSEPTLVTETVYAPAAHADSNAVTTTLASPVKQTELCSFNELEPPPVTEKVDSLPAHEDLHSVMTTLSLNQSYQDQSTELCSFNESERTLATETVLALAANADLNAVMSTLAYPVQSTELCSFNQSEPPLVAETLTSPLAEVDLNAVLTIKAFPVQQTELCSFNQSEPPLVAETVTSPLAEVDLNAVLTIKAFPVQQTELCSFNQSEPTLDTETVYAPAAHADFNAVTTTLASPVQQTELCSFNELEPTLVPETVSSPLAQEDLHDMLTIQVFSVQPTELCSFNELEPSPVTETVDSLPAQEDLHSVMTTLSSDQSYQDQSTELCSFNQSERTLAAETVLALAANADLNAVMSTLAYPIQSTEPCSFNQSERMLAAETVLAPAPNADLNAVMSTLASPVQPTELCSFNQSEPPLDAETVSSPLAQEDLNAVLTIEASPVQQTKLCRFNKLEPPLVTETVSSPAAHEFSNAMVKIKSFPDHLHEVFSTNDAGLTLVSGTMSSSPIQVSNNSQPHVVHEALTLRESSQRMELFAQSDRSTFALLTDLQEKMKEVLTVLNPSCKVPVSQVVYNPCSIVNCVQSGLNKLVDILKSQSSVNQSACQPNDRFHQSNIDNVAAVSVDQNKKRDNVVEENEQFKRVFQEKEVCKNVVTKRVLHNELVQKKTRKVAEIDERLCRKAKIKRAENLRVLINKRSSELLQGELCNTSTSYSCETGIGTSAKTSDTTCVSALTKNSSVVNNDQHSLSDTNFNHFDYHGHSDNSDSVDDTNERSDSVDDDNKVSDDELPTKITKYPKVKLIERTNSKEKNRRLPCVKCSIHYYNLPRHLESAHIDEDDVKLAAAKGKKSNEMKLLLNKGIFNHNICVLKEGEGIFIPARVSLERLVDDYVPCPYCLLMFVKEELFRHAKKNCSLRTIALQYGRNVVSDGAAILSGALGDDEIPELLRKQVIFKMRIDVITSKVKKDNLIMMFGTSLLHKLGPKRAADISQRMRQLARLTLRLQGIKSLAGIQLVDVLCGSWFDDIVTAIDVECGSYLDGSGRRLYKNPYIALKLGHSLIKVAHLKKGIAIRTGNVEFLKDADDYIALHTAEFTDRVSSPALASQRLRPNSLQEFPDEEDLQKLKAYQLDMLAKLIQKVEDNPNPSDWRHLADVALSRLIVFNARRGNEAAELLVAEYKLKSSHVDKSVADSMDAIEKQLLTRMQMIQVIGKRERPVPILILDDLLPAMDTLLRTRVECGVSEENEYFFALPMNMGHVSFYPALQRIAIEANLRQPKLVTSTRLRKHIATMAQLVNLTSGELDWLSKHLGHEVNIHKSSYRLHTSAVEITKVGRLLLSIDSGNASNFHGKRIDTMNAVNKRQLLDVEPDSDGVKPEPNVSNVMTKHEEIRPAVNKRQLQDVEPDSDGVEPEPNVSNVMKKHKDILPAVNKRQLQDVEPDSDELEPDSDLSNFLKKPRDIRPGMRKKKKNTIYSSDEEEDDDDEAPSSSSKYMRRNKPSKRVSWTEIELGVIRRAFSNHDRPPSFDELRDVQTLCPSLQQRSLPQIKSRAWALILAANKI